jgi:hypothetical protein
MEVPTLRNDGNGTSFHARSQTLRAMTLFVSSASTAMLGAGREHHRTPHAQIRNGHPLLQQAMSGHDETKSDIGGLKLLIVT